MWWRRKWWPMVVGAGVGSQRAHIAGSWLLLRRSWLLPLEMKTDLLQVTVEVFSLLCSSGDVAGVGEERELEERESLLLWQRKRERLLLVQPEMRKMAEREMVDSAGDEEDEDKMVPFCYPPLSV